jgi:beta-lactamase class A
MVSRLLSDGIVVWPRTSQVIVFTLAVSAPARGADADLRALTARLEHIINSSYGQVGVALVQVESGTKLSIHGDQRFPMASVYKLPIAVEALTQVSEGTLEMSRQVTLGPGDIRACCTLSRRYPRGGVTLTLGDLLELMMIESDNSAADAVLKLVGGPAVVQRRLRERGFNAINVNRYDAQISLDMTGVREAVTDAQWTLELQRRLIAEVTPTDLRAARARYTSDPRDTATPDDFAALLVRLQRGDLLPWPYGEQLIERMSHARTGPGRLKARLPPDTIVAHKTGTTDVVINDVGIITLPENRGHLVLAVFVMNGGLVSAMQTAIAEIAAAAYESFTGPQLPPPPKVVKAARKKRVPPRPLGAESGRPARRRKSVEK